jgi:hypothetical protein
MELDRTGKGQIDYDIEKQFFTKFYLEMEMNLKTELEVFSIELQTKSITDQTAENNKIQQVITKHMPCRYANANYLLN